MTTIHDEEKIKELLEHGSKGASYFSSFAKVIPTHVAEMLIKQYADYIRLKTIDEAIDVVSMWHGGYGGFVEDLEQLKK